jgi:uncharacterized protein (TIGR03083 family)
MNPLEPYVRAWSGAVDEVLALGAELDAADWSRPTDCPAWTVKDVLAHLADVETALCRTTPYPPRPELREVGPEHTQAGVSQRAGHAPEALLDELRTSADVRRAALDPLPDPTVPPPVTPAGLPWSWETLLRNRAIDLWVHEQDIRRATGRPGALDTLGAQVTTATFAAGMPYVVGKVLRPPAGTTIRWHATGAVPVDLTVRMGDDGRAAVVDAPERPTVALSMTSEDFAVLAAGRRAPDRVEVTVDGDAELGRHALAAMAVTP